MHRRHDPVTAMSRWILHMTKLAQQQPHTVATIGEIHTYPGACNIICDRVSFLWICALWMMLSYSKYWM